MRGGKSKALHDKVLINCEYSVAAFGSSERKQRGKGDRKYLELALEIKETFEAVILTHLYPKSQLDLYIQVRLLTFYYKLLATKLYRHSLQNSNIYILYLLYIIVNF